jgi:DNA polymerase-3 subunit gamma/tau
LSSSGYQVLARKYRPKTFADLKGQEALVRTLTNAIKVERIAHAFLLTGIRGVGKTTSARIIAKSINCTSLVIDESTITPCGACPNCTAIQSEKHPDIIEIDAASKTGVNDVREIIENVRYLPVMGKYKVYIIDEVHMLSTNAFNALLKTLEEPPKHTKFIFATTELRKIPITILSRCQRFDLRRLSNPEIIDHLKEISGKEGIACEPQALSLIAEVSEGSVRDSLSLLDQAIVYASTVEENLVTADAVIGMLGVSSKKELFNLLGKLINGEAIAAVEQLNELYKSGQDPVIILEGLLEVTNLITKLKISQELVESNSLSDTERLAAENLATIATIPMLTSIWQLLLKGIQETRVAMNSLLAAEMILIRVCYASKLPSIEEIVRSLQTGKLVANTNTPEDKKKLEINSFNELVKLFYQKKELILYHFLLEDVQLVKFAPGRLEIKAIHDIPKNMVANLTNYLQEWTGEKWVIIISEKAGDATLKEQAQSHNDKLKEACLQDPIVEKIISNFPGSKINTVKEVM